MEKKWEICGPWRRKGIGNGCVISDLHTTAAAHMGTRGQWSNGSLCIMRSYITLSRFRAAAHRLELTIQPFLWCGHSSKFQYYIAPFVHVPHIAILSRDYRQRRRRRQRRLLPKRRWWIPHTRKFQAHGSHKTHTRRRTDRVELALNSSKQIISNYSYFCRFNSNRYSSLLSLACSRTRSHCNEVTIDVATPLSYCILPASHTHTRRPYSRLTHAHTYTHQKKHFALAFETKMNNDCALRFVRMLKTPTSFAIAKKLKRKKNKERQ